MKKFLRFFVLIYLFVFSIGVNVLGEEFGKDANKYLEQITRIQRTAFTEGEVVAADYLGNILKDFGYNTVFEEIIFPDSAVIEFNQGEMLSHNIIATKEGSSDLEIIIGASYDSYNIGGSTGFEDATGVAALLEIAEKLKDKKLPYTVKFILFGASKAGNVGATHYVTTRSQQELNNIMYFINVSSIGSGQELHVYSNEGEKGFLREELMNLGKELKINVSTSPEFKDYDIAAGVGHDLSDAVAFKYSNVPYALIEATDWTALYEELPVPSDPTGEGVGVISGSEYDNYETVMEAYEERVNQNISQTVELIYNFLLKDRKSIKIITTLSRDDQESISDIEYTLIKNGKKIRTSFVDDDLVTEFKNLDEGEYELEVIYPDGIKFIKDMSKFKINFDSDGEFVLVNDQVDLYTYRKDITDIYRDIRETVKDEKFQVGIKDALYEYSDGEDGEKQEDTLNDEKNDMMIKIMGLILLGLLPLYIVLRIIFMIINKKSK